MKYIIDVPDEAVGFMDGEMSFFVEPKIKDERRRHYVLRIDEEDVSIYTEPDRKAIEDDVWELANYMERMSLTERDLCFGFPLPQEVTMNLSYNEAKSKFEAWMKQKCEICVGDEVKFDIGNNNDMKGIALDQTGLNGEWSVLTENGCVEEHDEEELYKTGRHFDEVEELLKKIGSEE